jgi:putative PIN family toxin of toxin-antitoxin system
MLSLPTLQSGAYCAEVMEVCISSHTLFTSEYILTEIKEALLNKVKLPKQIVHEIVSCLKDEGEMVQPAYVDSSMCQDRSDLSIFGTAIAGKAIFIVTGDDDFW